MAEILEWLSVRFRDIREFYRYFHFFSYFFLSFIHHIDVAACNHINSSWAKSKLTACPQLLLFINLGADSMYDKKIHRNSKAAAGCKPLNTMHLNLHLKWHHWACVILTSNRWSNPANLSRVKDHHKKRGYVRHVKFYTSPKIMHVPVDLISCKTNTVYFEHATGIKIF